MFKLNSKNASNTLFPSNGVTRDRWGEPVGATTRAPEISRGGAIDAAARMRWSLGHY